MNILTRGQVMNEGRLTFESIVAVDDQNRLVVTLMGSLRVDNPYRHLHKHLEDLNRILPGQTFASVLFDFAQLGFCHDHCFYVIMDIVDAVYLHVLAPVKVRRVINDDWQYETVPILLNLEDTANAVRTTFEDVTIS